MGKSSSRPLINETEIQKKLSNYEKKKFRSHFQKLSKSADLAVGRIEKDIFIGAYLARRLDQLSLLILERLWQVFAFKGKDEMTFVEYMQAAYLLEHIPSEPLVGDLDQSDLDLAVEEDRLRLIFAMMDVEVLGRLSVESLETALKKILIDRRVPGAPASMDAPGYEYMAPWFTSISEFIVLVFDQVDAYELSYMEFKRYARNDMTLMGVLEMLTPKRPDFCAIEYARYLMAETAAASRLPEDVVDATEEVKSDESAEVLAKKRAAKERVDSESRSLMAAKDVAETEAAETDAATASATVFGGDEVDVIDEITPLTAEQIAKMQKVDVRSETVTSAIEAELMKVHTLGTTL